MARQYKSSPQSGQPLEKIERDVDRDYIMEAAKAVEYGMIDRVISRRELH